MELTVNNNVVTVDLTVAEGLPTIGDNGNWFIDGIDTGAESTGEDGREVEFQKTETHIQWKYVTDAEWADLIALLEIKGDKGDPYVFEPRIVAGSRILENDDLNLILQFTANSPVTLTIPPGLDIQNRYQGKQLGEGQITFVAGSDVTIHKASEENLKTAGQYSAFQIDWIGTNEYHVYGRLELI